VAKNYKAQIIDIRFASFKSDFLKSEFYFFATLSEIFLK
jgi:hypothetical protein